MGSGGDVFEGGSSGDCKSKKIENQAESIESISAESIPENHRRVNKPWNKNNRSRTELGAAPLPRLNIDPARIASQGMSSGGDRMTHPMTHPMAHPMTRPKTHPMSSGGDLAVQFHTSFSNKLTGM